MNLTYEEKVMAILECALKKGFTFEEICNRLGFENVDLEDAEED